MASDAAALKEKKVIYTKVLFGKFSFKLLQIGVIGLGMVGNALVKNLKREGWEIENIIICDKTFGWLYFCYLLNTPAHRYNVTSILDTDTAK